MDNFGALAGDGFAQGDPFAALHARPDTDLDEMGDTADDLVPSALGPMPRSWLMTPRNAPCPCGSGKKYKHCHGALA